MSASTTSAADSTVSAVEPAPTPPARAAEGSDGKRLAVGEWAYFEGQLVPFAQATVSVATHALNYGTAIFEGIRAYRQADGGLAMLFALEHFQRLLRNGRLLKASVSETPEQLVAITCELLRRNGLVADMYIRPLLYKSAQSIRLQLTGLEDRITIFSFPLGDYVPTEGLSVGLSAWQRVNDNAVPARGKIAGSYVNACLAVEDAKAGGYGEAIMLTADGHVAEASSANLFIVTDGVIATPPVADDVLPGITRTAVLRLAGDLGRPVEVRTIDRTELYTCDEVFFSGTGAQIATVSSIDGRPVGSPEKGYPVTSELQAAYFAAVRGVDPRYAGWLTRVEGV
ncbi:MAG TPA: branched-chain amino acid transaminase [Candidatus Limnocylindrales bacterium]|nr:branched-chain amino acid transaminase [Candidatus Limnocylindrales bacterium]